LPIDNNDIIDEKEGSELPCEAVEDIGVFCTLYKTELSEGLT
jgi:hypothetical protein